MNRVDSISLNNALATQGLKVKHLSSTNYVSLINLKRSLATYLNNMGADEKILFNDFGLDESMTGEEFAEARKDKAFSDKLDLIQKKEFEPRELKFIPIEEFKKFTDDVDFIVGSTLAEYLLSDGKESKG